MDKFQIPSYPSQGKTRIELVNKNEKKIGLLLERVEISHAECTACNTPMNEVIDLHYQPVIIQSL